ADGEATEIEIINAVKANTLTDEHRRDYARVAGSLDVDAYLIACTELSVIGPPAGITKPHIDALDVLVEATVAAAI
ncbi:MAG TPA: hypothetical protein VFV07_12855, partial [Rhizomicrobium sp.]|nr:hypothetical protein [Rhizomicrobium sp.]